MKRVLILILVLTLIGSIFAFFGCEKKDAETGEQENTDAVNEQDDEEPYVTPDGADFRYEATEGGVTITAYTGTEKRIAIPSTINGKTVICIDVFNSETVQYLKIADSVTSILPTAFQNNHTIVELTFGSGIEEILSSAFRGLKTLQKVRIGNNTKTIQNEAFFQCSALDTVILPQGLTTIGNYAFSECNLLSITIPGTVKEIGGGAFSYNRYLSNVVFEEGVNFQTQNNILSGQGMFYTCPALETLVVPASVTDISDTTFLTGDVCNLKTIRFLGDAPRAVLHNSFTPQKQVIAYYPADAAGWDTTTIAELYTLTPYQPE